MKTKDFFIGLMSGTSADGIDVVIVQFAKQGFEIIAQAFSPFSAELQNEIIRFNQPAENELNRLGELDTKLGQLFANAVNSLLVKAKLAASDIKAIGSHGQNVRHHPQELYPFTLQIGNPHIIAAQTGITTVADFRRKDVALGGQGAPLAPAFHDALFRAPDKNRIVLNIGGIANMTYLGCEQETLGFDTGPGNCLMNAWCLRHRQQPFDDNGNWAKQGKVNNTLLQKLLSDPYFSKANPKSTGREYFNLNWLSGQLNGTEDAIDVQATLLALTVHSISADIKRQGKIDEVIVCGGGVHNTYLMQCLQQQLEHCKIYSSAQLHVDPNSLEAVLFAWLAKQRMNHLPGNLPSVTGAKQLAVLGAIH